MSLFLPLEEKKKKKKYKMLDTDQWSLKVWYWTYCKLHKCMDVSLIQSLGKILLLLPAIRNPTRKLRWESAGL